MSSGPSDDNRSIGSSHSGTKSRGSYRRQQIFTDICYFRGIRCAIKKIQNDHVQVTRLMLIQLKDVRIIDQLI